MSSLSLSLWAQSHYIQPSTDLNDFAWAARKMHRGSVRPFVQSVACVQKLRIVQLFRPRRIRLPIRSRLFKYTQSVWCIHFAITSMKKQENPCVHLSIYFLKNCGVIGLFLVTCCFCHLLYSYPHIGFVAGNDLIGCSMRPQRLVPYTSDMPSVIRRRTQEV